MLIPLPREIRRRTITSDVHKTMTKEQAEKIMRIYNWGRIIILVAFLTFVLVVLNWENLETL